MEHLQSEQILQIALNHKGDPEGLFFQECYSSPKDAEALLHLEHCVECQEKLQQVKNQNCKVAQMGEVSPPPNLANNTFQLLQNHPSVVHTQKVIQWMGFSPVGRTLILSAAMIFLCFQIFIPTFSHAQTMASQESCQAHLKALYNAVMTYVKTQKEYPPTNRAGFLTTLYKSNILKDPDALQCPGTQTQCFGCIHPWMGPEVEKPQTYPSLIEKDKLSAIGYEGRYYPINPNMSNKFIPIIWDKAGNHEKGRNVLYLNGQIEFISEEKFRKLFKSRFHDYPLDLYQ